MNKKLKIAFVSVLDIKDRNNWSGTLYYTYNTLKKYAEIIPVSPLNDVYKYRYALNKVINKYLFKKNYNLTKKIKVVKKYSREAKRKLESLSDYDIVFTMGSASMAYLDIDKPIISYTDSVFKASLNYYGSNKNLTDSQIKEANLIEKEGLKRCALVFFSSDWACDYAKKYLNASQQNKVKKLLFGLNLEDVISKESLKVSIESKVKSKVCNLIFVGKEWERKGGDRVISTLQYLREKKILKCKLTIIGCNPDIEDEDIKIIEYLNKNNETERKEYEEILKKAHFLILPTRADCTPMVVVEANAFGIPALVSNTGGIPSIIDNNKNGYLMKYEDSGKEYGEKIFDLFSNKDKYKKLCVFSREHYELKTNWDTTCKKLIEEINNYLENNK